MADNKQQTAAIVTYALLLVLAQSGPACSLSRSRYSWWKPELVDHVPIHAFKMEICGRMSEGAVRPWHKQQSALGCAQNASSSGQVRLERDSIAAAAADEGTGQTGQSRVVKGEQALKDEFPFMVEIKIYGNDERCWDRTCSGVIVHMDIVLTAASCFTPRHSWCLDEKVKVFVREPKERVIAKRWCWLSQDSRGYHEHGLAAIKLMEPLLYVPGKLEPACLPRSNVPHAAGATCAIAGYGMTDLDWTDKDTFAQIQTTTVRRDTTCARDSQSSQYEACYRSTGGFGCRRDQGGPVVCYDRCSKRRPDSVQPFALGILSRGVSCDSQTNGVTRAIDIQASYGQLLELLWTTHEDKIRSPNVICSDTPAKSINFEEIKRNSRGKS